MDITIKGRIPSKKNCKMALPIKGRCMVVNSGAYTKWKKEAGMQLLQYPRPRSPFEKIKIILMDIFAPDKRESDLTNKAESIMDLLVDSGFIKDDNWFVVGEIVLGFGGVDKENPRAEIQIII